jgi:hypothetical protein
VLDEVAGLSDLFWRFRERQVQNSGQKGQKAVKKWANGGQTVAKQRFWGFRESSKLWLKIGRTVVNH